MMTCNQPRLHERIADLCFGRAEGEERSALEAHLLICDSCWIEFQRVSEAIHALRAEKELIKPVMAADLIQLVGLGARLHRPLGGHVAVIAIVAIGYGVMIALALLAEVAYQWDTYGRWASTVGFLAGLCSTLVCWGSFESARRRLAAGGMHSLLFAALPLIAWTLLVSLAIAPFLSADPMVLAGFQTLTGRIGWIKSASQALQIPLLSLIPFHFVLTMQCELSANHIDRVLRLLTNDPRQVIPRGAWFVRPLLAGVVFVIFAAWWIIGTAHLLENLRPSPFMALFMMFGLSRMVVVIAALFAVLLWYTRLLNDLKREAIAISAGLRVLDAV